MVSLKWCDTYFKRLTHFWNTANILQKGRSEYYQLENTSTGTVNSKVFFFPYYISQMNRVFSQDEAPSTNVFSTVKEVEQILQVYGCCFFPFLKKCLLKGICNWKSKESMFEESYL